MIKELLMRVGAQAVAVVAEGEGRKVIANAKDVENSLSNGFFMSEQSVLALCQTVSCKSQGGRFIVIEGVKDCPGCKLLECAKCPVKKNG